jgi:ribonuclease HIII
VKVRDAAALRAALETAGAQPREAKGDGEVLRYDLVRDDGRAQVTLWRTGTCHVTGSGTALAELRAVVDDLAEGAPPPTAAAVPLDLPRNVPWAGADESGKGDYFGPLVSAAVGVEPDAAQRLVDLGVQDSKRLTDARVRALAVEIEAAAVHALTTVAPPRYNELYADMRRERKNLNALLAWAHARSLNALLQAGARPRYVIVDQFADARHVEERFAPEDVDVHQFPRAESDVAVAAASILARRAFVDWLDRASERTGVRLPKGASPQVIAAAREVVARGGRDALAGVAKLHFATTKQVLE